MAMNTTLCNLVSAGDAEFYGALRPNLQDMKCDDKEGNIVV